MSWALLIVEDEPDIREELAEILQARGFRPIAASNGIEALDVATRQGIRPAVILLDLVMPLMNGLEFLERQHEVPLLAGVPVVVITAQKSLATNLPPTVRAVMEKPLQLPALLAIVRDACGSIPMSVVQ
jgi:CheY-like chemotaxis protein